MGIVPYTKKMLLQRIRKHLNNGFSNDAWATSDKEIILYIDQAVAFSIVGKAYEGAKIDGALVVPEAFLFTYDLGNPIQDNITGYWVVTLPQPPLSLPLGYSINRAYFASSANGVSQEIYLIKAKRVGYRQNLPRPTGTSGWVENSRFLMQASNGQPLGSLNLFVQMPISRTDDVNDSMILPDDIIQPVFDAVVKELTQRYQMPKDIINDDLPAGNKSS
jgi:hypothetical protein